MSSFSIENSIANNSSYHNNSHLPQTQSAFLLHSRPYKENQLLLDFITEEEGRVSAITFTGRSVKSNKRAVLQPFSPLTITYKGTGTLKKLTLAESAGKSFSFKGNFLYSGFYLNELMIRLLAELIPCKALYQQYVISLSALNEQKSLEVILRNFELMLLEELGQTIDFSDVAYSETSHFYYIVEQGFIPAINKLPQPCYDKQHLLAIASGELNDQQVLYSFKLLMRQIMTPLLGNKPLNSRKLFKKSSL